MDEDYISQSNCDNCGTELEGIYCHNCGQRKIDFKTDWNSLVHDIVSSFWHFDGKFLQGILELTFKPWRLTKSFLDGKRVSQIPPLRTYFFVSLLFFLTVQIGENDSSDYFDKVDEADINETLSDPDTDELERWVIEKIRNREAIKETFKLWFPRMFMLGVVVLALMSRIAYFKHHYVYIEHLVIALNLQSFAFIWILFSRGWTQLIGLLWEPIQIPLFSLFLIWLFLCPIIAYKKIFESSKRRALVIGFFLEMFYLGYLITGIVGVSLISLFLS